MCLAIPGKILSISDQPDNYRSGDVNFSGVIRSVNLAYVPEARENDYVVVHAGFAISVLDQTEAHASLAAFDELKNTLDQIP